MKTFTVYTDGSFGDNGEVHGGMVYYKDGELTSCIHVMSKLPEFISMRNVGGEILAAWSAIMSVASVVRQQNEECMDTYEMNLIYDYKGIGCWLKREWKTNKSATQWFVKSVNEVLKDIPNLKINYIWVKGHSDTVGNNYADKVAAYNMEYCKAKDIPIINLDEIVKVK